MSDDRIDFGLGDPHEEPEVRVVQVPALPIHPRLIEKAKQQRAELERLLTPEALARLDAAEAEATRRFIEGGKS